MKLTVNVDMPDGMMQEVARELTFAYGMANADMSPLTDTQLFAITLLQALPAEQRLWLDNSLHEEVIHAERPDDADR